MQWQKVKSPEQNRPIINAAFLKRPRFEKVVIITRKTELEELTTRFNSIAQAKFYLEHAGQDFEPVEKAHKAITTCLI